jgi:putative tryptophan/tyrosine transport system substrate-binding protein
MAIGIGRRGFVTLGGAALVWPLVARAQQPTSTSRRLGILAGWVKGQDIAFEAFALALKESGWVEGQNIAFEYRFADGKEDVLPKLAAELLQLRVDAILTDGTPATQAAKNATRTVPIVMAAVNDPIASGLVASLHRPGGNITGMSILTTELASRRLQLLTEMVPGLARVAVLSNPLNPSLAPWLKQMQTAAQSLGIELYVAEAPTPDKIESAFATIATARADALIVFQDAMFFAQHPRVVAFAAASHLPALFGEKEEVEAGGLMSYGPSILASFRRAAAYVDKILRGANPADLPIELPTTFELVINLKTAKALGLTIPDKVLTIADDVIE